MKAKYAIPTVAASAAGLYLLAIMPRMGNRKRRKDFLNVYYAHRGLHDNDTDAPEIPWRPFAGRFRPDTGVEMDVQLSKDGVPVVFHDFTLKRICGKEGKVCDYTCEELQSFRLCGSEETIPKFEDVLNEVRGRVPLIVELKVERANLALCPVVDAMLEKVSRGFIV